MMNKTEPISIERKDIKVPENYVQNEDIEWARWIIEKVDVCILIGMTKWISAYLYKFLPNRL